MNLQADTRLSQSACWHALSAQDALAALESNVDGLSNGEVERRLSHYGPNRLRPPTRRGPLARFALQFHNVLIYILLAASLITALLGHWVDTVVILGVVMVNTLIGFFQEGKAERALEAIGKMLSPQAAVFREGKRLTIPAEELVPGDVVFLQSGDKVPADLRLVRVKDLRLSEAILTGESEPVDKATAPVEEGAPDKAVVRNGWRRCDNWVVMPNSYLIHDPVAAAKPNAEREPKRAAHQAVPVATLG